MKPTRVLVRGRHPGKILTRRAVDVPVALVDALVVCIPEEVPGAGTEIRPATGHVVDARRRGVVRDNLVDGVIGRRVTGAVLGGEQPALRLVPRAERRLRPPLRAELRGHVRRGVMPLQPLPEGGRRRLPAERQRAVGVAQGRHVAGEEPRAVPHDRSAQGEAWLRLRVAILRVSHVLGARRVRRLELQRWTRARVEALARPEEQPLAVPVIGAALRDDVQHAAGGPAVLGAVPGRLHLELLDEVGDQELARRADPGVGGLHAVDDHAVLCTGRSVDGDAAGLALLVRTRRLHGERREVAAARQPFEHLAAHVRGADRLRDRDARRATHDLQCLGDAGRTKRQVHAQLRTQHQDDLSDLRELEAVEDGGHLVAAWRERGESVRAGRAGHCFHREAGAVRCRHRNRWHESALHVADDALDCAGLLLRPRRGGRERKTRKCRRPE